MSAACTRTQSLIDNDTPEAAARALKITQYLCHRGEHRIATLLRELHLPTDAASYQLAQDLLKQESPNP